MAWYVDLATAQEIGDSTPFEKLDYDSCQHILEHIDAALPETPGSYSELDDQEGLKVYQGFREAFDQYRRSGQQLETFAEIYTMQLYIDAYLTSLGLTDKTPPEIAPEAE